MTPHKPLVSVGMPVYNGEDYIAEALNSLLAQDYEYFELIVSDNASTDRTPNICRDFESRDSRLRYVRREVNRGALMNFKSLVEEARGKYVMWAGAHDLWHPSFIRRCVEVLESESDVVVVYPLTMLIDSAGYELGIAPDRIDTRGLSALSRYKRLIWQLSWCNMIYGLIRRTALEYVSFRAVWGPDHLTLAELTLQGSIAQVQEPLFYRREERKEDYGSKEHRRRVWAAIDPDYAANKAMMTMPELFRELRDAHLRLVARTKSMGVEDKLRAVFSTVDCFRTRFGIEFVLTRFARAVGRNLRRWSTL